MLVQLNVSPGGMPKLPVDAARVTKDGVAGDWQKNRKYHGGPNRAVCIYSEELYADLQTEGLDLVSGAFGENFTTRGLNLQRLRKGDRLRVGGERGCTIEITNIRVPCNSLKKWSPALPQLITGRSGWVAKVLKEGEVRPGDAITLLPRTTNDSASTIHTERSCSI